MNTHADRKWENKRQSVSNERYHKESGYDRAFQFIDNRPEAVAQKKLQEVANKRPHVTQAAGFQFMADKYRADQSSPKKYNNGNMLDTVSSFGADDVIQCTTWRYRNEEWSIETTSENDQDEFASPENYCRSQGITAGVNDKYDQDAGTYYSWEQARDLTAKRGKKRKRPKGYGDFYSGGRETTPYGLFQPVPDSSPRNEGNQGPHLAAFIFKKTVFDLAKNMGLLDSQILNSKIAPEPRQALQLMIDQLEAREVAYEKAALLKWYNLYEAAYNKVNNGEIGAKKAKKQLLELHPLSVYRVGETANKVELQGKKEKASPALDDIDNLIEQSPRPESIPSGLTTIDYGFRDEGWENGDALRRDYIFNLALASIGRPPSPFNYPAAPMSPAPGIAPAISESAAHDAASAAPENTVHNDLL